ncbi:TPA_asm: hypothetical protein GJA49_15160, partial [Listeria monocytogenes]|nr:hypothetical protein [Listeria monocytogenes]HAC1744345.1 hypothetical protein [Listeria monocytogenes]HAC2153922.1 hypothetical protein [Listeria monocytogenes]
NKNKARIGFYYLVFDLLYNMNQVEEVNTCITDQTFSNIMRQQDNKDLGIDAVYIDEENKEVNFFNFKYREKFIKGKTKAHDELRACEPFLLYVQDTNSFEKDKSELSNFTREKLNDIADVKKDSQYSYKLYMVTNDMTTTDIEEPQITAFKKNYSWLEVEDINLATISEWVSIRSKENVSILVLENESLLQHGTSYETANSYVAEVSLVELIKMTSQNIDLRMKENIDDLSIEELADLEIDLDVLFDNVRGYLGNTNYNKKILETLKKEPGKFFLFNNGITITADDINVKEVRLGKASRIKLDRFQVVNGGQSLRTIYKYKDQKDSPIENLAKASVLVRFFKTGQEEGLINKVSEYTNSQNAISAIDLRTVDQLQLKIEKHLELKGIQYIRKRSSDKTKLQLENSITMEKLGQLLFAYAGYPEKAGNNKRKIFSEYYEKVFTNESDLMDRIISTIDTYHKIISLYNDDDYKYYEQKVYYIIYLKRFLSNKNLKECLELFEDVLLNYETKQEVSPSRKLLQSKFKEEINRIIKLDIGDIKGLINL